MNGSILRGAHDIAGAIGWMGLDRPYRAAYCRCGGFESHASGAGIARVRGICSRGSPNTRARCACFAPGQVTAHAVFKAFAAGDDLAERVVANAVECWGMAVANLVSLFDPEMIVLGGGLFGPAARQLDRIVAEARAIGAADQFRASGRVRQHAGTRRVPARDGRTGVAGDAAGGGGMNGRVAPCSPRPAWGCCSSG